MIIGELTWQQFKSLDSIRNLDENRQLQHYYEYLVELNEWTIHQNKGELTTQIITCADGMDVVFIVDITASMGDEIDAIKASIASIVSTIITESGNNYRLGLVVFDEYNPNISLANYETLPAYTNLPLSQRYTNNYDNVQPLLDRKQYITAMEMMSLSNQSSFTSQLNVLNTVDFPLGYGESFPEPSDMGVDRVVNYDLTGTFRDNVTKLIVLITDASSSGNDDDNTAIDFTFANTLIANCVAKGVKILLMKDPFESQEPLPTLALGTGGLVSESFTPEAIITSIENICA